MSRSRVSVCGDPCCSQQVISGEHPGRGRADRPNARFAAAPGEGGLFRRTYIDAYFSVIYFMLIAPDFSALHSLDGVETYHWYAGSPLRLLLLHPGGQVAQPVLGANLARGARPQVVVPSGVWQGSSSLGEWTLAGTTTAPAFEWSAFHLGRRAELVSGWTDAAARIRALTRA